MTASKRMSAVGRLRSLATHSPKYASTEGDASYGRCQLWEMRAITGMLFCLHGPLCWAIPPSMAICRVTCFYFSACNPFVEMSSQCTIDQHRRLKFVPLFIDHDHAPDVCCQFCMIGAFTNSVADVLDQEPGSDGESRPAMHRM